MGKDPDRKRRFSSKKGQVLICFPGEGDSPGKQICEAAGGLPIFFQPCAAFLCTNPLTFRAFVVEYTRYAKTMRKQSGWKTRSERGMV